MNSATRGNVWCASQYFQARRWLFHPPLQPARRVAIRLLARHVARQFKMGNVTRMVFPNCLARPSD